MNGWRISNFQRTENLLVKDDQVDINYYDVIDSFDTECPCEEMDAEDPLFILYTSGSTGKPKGVLHTTAGYLLGAALSHKYIFNLKKVLFLNFNNPIY